MSTLHIVSCSPHSGTALQDCLQATGNRDAILLIENGVYALAGPATKTSLEHATELGVNLLALEPDLLARGLSVPDGFPAQLVDYSGFVALVTEHLRSVTWA